MKSELRRWVVSGGLGCLVVLLCACASSPAANSPTGAERPPRPADARIIGSARITGAVNSPGQYYFWDYEEFGLFQLLFKAYGLTDDASDDCVIIRTDETGKKSGQQHKIESRIGLRSRGGNVMLRDGDEVFFAKQKAAGASLTKNKALSGLDAKWREFGVYLQKLIDAVQFQWEREILKQSRVPASGTTVVVKFFVNDAGRVARIVSTEGTASDIAIRLCTDAIMQAAPYGAWTDEMRAALGSEQEMTFTFHYQ